MSLKMLGKLGIISLIGIMLTSCFGSTVNSFCSVYKVDQFYPNEKVLVQAFIKDGTPITLEPLKIKLDNLAAHDSQGC